MTSAVMEEFLTLCLLEQLECPVCQEQAGGEIYQCYRGHVMCGNCRPRLHTCPVCRAALLGPPIRNRALENLSMAIAK